ncbi:hypothetical protein [Flavobacterium poyangense]|uniref:hypothetical protein n=1 Tax=Flavobacterium poyangense TaxID=2204302 RepID=UPI001421C59B|nr:hypothetical protein [Flavobacterium sp. JXAS1]
MKLLKIYRLMVLGIMILTFLSCSEEEQPTDSSKPAYIQPAKTNPDKRTDQSPDESGDRNMSQKKSLTKDGKRGTLQIPFSASNKGTEKKTDKF